ncbi:MAG: hypothetical protein H7338_22315 [Candidatus Sericytochromatia bacterium]|nr:hypothetical protein [Candidatus Sericytochromatia bacterium]
MLPLLKIPVLHLVVLLLCLTWVGNMPFLGGPPNLMLVLAVVIGTHYGWLAGGLSGVVGGALIDIWLGHGVSHMLCYGLTAAGSGFIGGLYLIRSVGGSVLSVFMATWLGELIMAAIINLLGYPIAWEHWQATTPWVAMYNVLFTPLAFWLVGSGEDKRPSRARPSH